MNFPFQVQPARFVARPNRYVVMAQLACGEVVRAHCADPGRLRELLLPGVRLYVSPASRPDRRTEYDLRFVVHPQTGNLVSLDSRLPNMVVAEALAQRRLPMFADYDRVRAEVSLPAAAKGAIRSRVDFLLSSERCGRCWLEVKSVTLVEAGRAEFPDAPTSRGTRHVRELAHIARLGVDRAAVLFVVQRDDAEVLAPRRQTDPIFADALVDAHLAGVGLYAYTCCLTQAAMELNCAIPIDLSLPLD